MRRAMGAAVVILGWSLLGAHASGCGSSDSNTPSAADAAADTATHACTAGQSVACTGPGGCSGGQVCKSDSSGFDACICGGAGGDAGSDAATDSSVADATTDGGTCKPGNVSTFQPPAYKSAKRGSGSCTPTQLGAFFDDCLGPVATSALCAANFGANATAANKTCAACIQSADTAPAYGPLVVHAGTVSINFAGCMEIKQGNATCATAYQAAEACKIAACAANCPVTDPASLQLYLACGAQAAANGCKTFADNAACANAAADAGAASVCFQGQTFQDQYNSVTPVFCGP